MIASRASLVRRITGLSHNFVSFVGAALAFVSGLSIVFLFVGETMSDHENPYLGIATYIVFPGFFAFGAIVTIAGMLIERQRRRRSAPGDVPAFPIIDLNDARRRRSIVAFLGCLFVFVLLSAFGSYRAYEYTESVAFCG